MKEGRRPVPPSRITSGAKPLSGAAGLRQRPASGQVPPSAAKLFGMIQTVERLAGQLRGVLADIQPTPPPSPPPPSRVVPPRMGTAAVKVTTPPPRRHELAAALSLCDSLVRAVGKAATELRTPCGKVSGQAAAKADHTPQFSPQGGDQVRSDAAPAALPSRVAAQQPPQVKDDSNSRVRACVDLILEAVAWNTGAHKASLQLHSGSRGGSDLVTVAAIGYQGLRKGQGRVAVSRAASGTVQTTGIALNQSSKDRTDAEGQSAARPDEEDGPWNDRVCSLLAFPVSRPGNAEVIGVVQMVNKAQGASFTSADEHVVHAAIPLISYLIDRYPVNWSDPGYEPATTWEGPPPPSKLLPPVIGTHSGRQLIYRGGQSGQYVRERQLVDCDTQAEALGPCATLREVDDYLRNLERCWRRSVALSIDFEGQNEEKLSLLRGMRDEVRSTKLKSKALEEELTVHTMDVSEYRLQYDRIRADLQGLLDSKNDSKIPASPAQRSPGRRHPRRVSVERRRTIQGVPPVAAALAAAGPGDSRPSYL
eukprot:TRINITY_DN29446_c0_g1_i2.p1 TRINITY_DN29446_c0_g1~~TRINITY_DN29446_c0_g1_i2.p1  ORF type:complete len:536 (+),score=142.11 TRINITY_DN29446_c0_g1_i2:97-1704(+)